ncbi:MAG: hypothetical protein ACYS0D_09050 [Planctomycetota bacterium]|jgi:hypothetical protein
MSPVLGNLDRIAADEQSQIKVQARALRRTMGIGSAREKTP